MIDLFTNWQRILEERAGQSMEALSQVPGVLGLILCGSLGRREGWPLSDVDLILIYEDGEAERASAEVEAARVALLDEWMDEGLSTSLDAGKLAFARSEVEAALSLPPGEATQLLDDPGWFHSLDKGYRGRAAFDPDGLAAPLAAWLTEARFAPEVMRGRIEAHWRQTLTYQQRAVKALHDGNPVAAELALRESLHALMRNLIERWGGRDNSFARFGTRFAHTAADRGEQALAGEIFTLAGLDAAGVARRLALTPEGIRLRHRLSLAARKLVGEPISADEDARDVLLVFSTMRMRHGLPPFPVWIDIAGDAAVTADRVERYSRLLERMP